MFKLSDIRSLFSVAVVMVEVDAILTCVQLSSLICECINVSERERETDESCCLCCVQCAIGTHPVNIAARIVLFGGENAAHMRQFVGEAASSTWFAWFA